MNPGYVYMLLALGSFSLLGIFHKVADVKKCRPSAITALLYTWSFLFVAAFILFSKRGNLQIPSTVGWIAIPFGISAAIALLAFQAGIRFGKISTSWLIINLSAGIPTVGSILIYREPVGLQKSTALVLIVISIVFLWKDKQIEDRRDFALSRKGRETAPASPSPTPFERTGE